MWSGLGSQFKKTFRFEQFCLEHPYFKEKIRTWWEELSEDEGQTLYKFQQKLKGLKNRVKKWNMEEFGNIFVDKNIIEYRIQEIQSIGMNEGYTNNMQMEEIRLYSQLEEWEK